MSRLNFEKQFKEKLEDREIRPSAGSWENLESRLNGADKKPKWIWWAGAAASIASGILILSLVFKQNSVPQAPEIVNQPSEIEIRFEEQNNESKQLLESESLVTTENFEKETNSKKGTRGAASGLMADSEEEFQKDKRTPLKTISKKTEMRVASVESAVSFESNASNKKHFQKVTEAEITALLQEAQRNLSHTDFESEKNQISAQALLHGVETEINRSFRDKILSDLGEKLLEFALVSRNN